VASRPPISAPKNNPKVLALKKVPNCCAVGWNSAPIPAAATPAACKSIPSHSAAHTQNMIVLRRAGRFMRGILGSY